MNTHNLLQRAFTLIELMVAVAIGMIIVYMAVAGVRVATQTATIANRLSLENGLIRAGMNQAHDELDFWTNLDDPDDPSRQALRGTTTAANAGKTRVGDFGMTNEVGFAFTPFSGKDGIFKANTAMKPGMSIGGSAVPRFPSSIGTNGSFLYDHHFGALNSLIDDRDDDIGFDPTAAWAPHDPRTWYRGNVIEKMLPQRTGLPSQWFGRYNIFMNFDQDPVFKSFVGISDGSTNYDATYAATGLPPHRWYSRQLAGLNKAFGFYGMCNYMPSNAIFEAYCSWANGRTSDGGIALLFKPQNTFIGDGMMEIPGLGLYALTVTQSYGIINPYGSGLVGGTLANEHFRWFKSDYTAYGGGGAAQLQDFMRKTLYPENLMDAKPEIWPEVSVGVGRYIKSAKFANLARVRWYSPITGELSELTFTSVCTSLRGARMQRKRDGGGWAQWDNGAGATNDLHLDSP